MKNRERNERLQQLSRQAKLAFERLDECLSDEQDLDGDDSLEEISRLRGLADTAVDEWLKFSIETSSRG